MNTKQQFLIIGGTFKSGTSALFTYLGQVPGICGSSVKETGFFVPVRYGLDAPSQEEYMHYFRARQEDDQYLMEASPGYLRGAEGTAEYIRNFLGQQPKIIFLFREPVARFISLFKMISENNDVDMSKEVAESGMSLQEYYAACAQYKGNTNFAQEDRDYLYNGLSDGHYAEFLERWYAVYPAEDIRVIFFEDLIRDPEQSCIEVLKWLNLHPKGTEGIVFRPVNQYHSARSKALRAFAYRVNKRFQGFFRRNERLKRWLVRWYKRINARKNVNEATDSGIRKELSAYYAPHNAALLHLLKDKGYSQFPEWLSE